MRDDAIQAIAMVTPPPLPPSLPPSFLWDALTKSEHPGWCVAMQTSPSARLNISMQEVRSPPPPSLTPIPLVKVKRRKRSWGVWGGDQKPGGLTGDLHLLCLSGALKENHSRHLVCLRVFFMVQYVAFFC